MAEDKKRYVVQQGFSLTSKKGIVHAGGVVSADILSVADPEKFLEDLAEKGKIKLESSKTQGEVKKPETEKTQEPENKPETEKEPVVEKEEPKEKDKKGFGAQRK